MLRTYCGIVIWVTCPVADTQPLTALLQKAYLMLLLDNFYFICLVCDFDDIFAGHPDLGFLPDALKSLPS